MSAPEPAPRPTDAHARDAALESPWTGRAIPDVFEATAERYADRLAIDDGETRLSYAELRDRAARIAAALAARLTQPGQHVALLVEPGADAAAAILGVLTAGHAYVPLDPDDPPARLELMLRDCGAAITLAGSAYVDLARRLGGDGGNVLPIDDAVRARETRVDRIATTDATAFVMYTSGSTGQPKGVLQTHRNLLHYVRRYSEFLRVTPDDRLSMLYSLSFSASSMDVYGALLNGATLCFLNVRRRGVARLADWVDGRGITVLHTVPTLFRHLLDHADARVGFARVRAVDLGGEAVVGRDLDRHRARFAPECVLVNHLAATEISVIAQQILEPDRDSRNILPVGHPAPGVVVRVLNEAGQVADPDEPGEIVIHSPFLSAGYWQQPALTAAAFADDPERPGWRTYRGGDMGSMSADGVLSALGRRDAVVKVRGHSVHLAEVEAALRQVPGVDEGAVMAMAEADPPARIVASVVSPSLDAAAVRRALSDLLPTYARPSDVRLVDALPRTASGKIDRRALAALTPSDAPSSTSASASASSAPIADDIERDVAALFARLLKVPSVGRDDDFFDLGGHSLLLTELQMELERRAGRELATSALLEARTVAGMAALLRESPARDEHAAWSVLVPLRESGSRPPLFLVHGGAGTLGVGPHLLQAFGADQPVYTFRARGLDGRSVPHRHVVEMAADYISLMRQVQPEGPYHLGAACAGAIVAHEMACQLRAAGQRLAPLLFIDPPRPPRQQGLPRLVTKVGTLWFALLMVRRPRTRSFIAQRLGKRRWSAALGDSATVWPESHMRVWIWLRIAAFRHRLRVYDGPVQVIASRERIAEFQPGGAWHNYLTGDVHAFEVAPTHRGVFDPSNADAAAHLRRYVELTQTH